jgi:hypothetical protein
MLEYLAHEHDEVIEVDGHSIRVRIDYACRTPSNDLTLVEWKSARQLDIREGGYQLAVYTLWAHEVRGMPLDKIHPVLADIFGGELNWFQATPLDMSYVLDWVREDVELVDGFTRAQNYPASPEPGKCMACRFASRCPEGQVAISERSR